MHANITLVDLILFGHHISNIRHSWYLQTGLGVKAFLKGKSSLDKNTVREFKPFIAANWIYNTRQYGASMNGDGETIHGTRNTERMITLLKFSEKDQL